MERRGSPRYVMEQRSSARYKMRVKVMFGYGAHWEHGMLDDVSTTGVKIKAHRVYKPGTKVRVNIPDDRLGDFLISEGHVVWAVEPMRLSAGGMGIRLSESDC